MEKQIQEKINKWKNFNDLDVDLKDELNELTEEQLEDSFYKNLEFGTGGLRAKIGAGTNRLNIYTIRRITEGYAQYILENTNNASIVVAYDNRKNSYNFALETARIFSKYNIKTYIFETLRPTPELSFAVRELNAFGGIVITASHNPKEYNGYKIYDSNGCQVTLEMANAIIKKIDEITDELSIEIANEDKFNEYTNFIGKNIDEKYYERVMEVAINKDIKKDLKIVFTPQHGTSNIPVRTVLSKLGYNVIPVKEQLNPDPLFSNTKSPNPENNEAFDLAIEYSKKFDADIAISTDPDCDRLGVVVKHNGEYILLTGNQTGAILLEYIITNLKNNNNLPNNSIIYNTIVTSDLGKDIAESYGVEVFSTLTGFKFIGEQIELKKDKNFIFGYEESYGYLIKDFVRDKDAVQSTVIIAEVANYYKSKNMTLKDALDNIYKKYGYYYDKLDSLTYEGAKGTKKINNIMSFFRDNNIKLLSNSDIKIIEDYKTSIRFNNGKEEQLFLPKSNVLKYIFDDGSWLALRPSGTEPKCKFYYCIKAPNEELAKAKYNEIKNNLDKYINNID